MSSSNYFPQVDFFVLNIQQQTSSTINSHFPLKKRGHIPSESKITLSIIVLVKSCDMSISHPNCHSGSYRGQVGALQK